MAQKDDDRQPDERERGPLGQLVDAVKKLFEDALAPAPVPVPIPVRPRRHR
jgi:hypothetical protein